MVNQPEYTPKNYSCFKVGDRVKIRSYDDMREEFGDHRCGGIRTHYRFEYRMRHLA